MLRAFSVDAELVLLDEPFSALDTVSKAQMMGLTYQMLKERGVASVFVTHDLDEAVALARLGARSGQTVLLSPASASFDEFSGYEERGEKFCAIVQEFANESRARETVCEAAAFTETE